jgi:hypothetical protein
VWMHDWKVCTTQRSPTATRQLNITAIGTVVREFVFFSSLPKKRENKKRNEKRAKLKALLGAKVMEALTRRCHKEGPVNPG